MKLEARQAIWRERIGKVADERSVGVSFVRGTGCT